MPALHNTSLFEIIYKCVDHTFMSDSCDLFFKIGKFEGSQLAWWRCPKKTRH